MMGELHKNNRNVNQRTFGYTCAALPFLLVVGCIWLLDAKKSFQLLQFRRLKQPHQQNRIAVLSKNPVSDENKDKRQTPLHGIENFGNNDATTNTKSATANHDKERDPESEKRSSTSQNQTSQVRMDLKWEYHRYSTGGGPHVVVCQYSSWEDYYSQMTNLSQRANQAYAKYNGYDYMRLNGVAYGRKRAGAEATYNKVFLLQKLLSDPSERYDAALLLDSDSVVVDFQKDIWQLLLPNILLTAHKIRANHSSHTFEVNAGTTLWNLRHPKAQKVIKHWASLVAKKVRAGEGISDQVGLHRTLQTYTEQQRVTIVDAINLQGHCGPPTDGTNTTLVRHFIRGKEMPKDWYKPGGTYFVPTQGRLDRIEACVVKVCQRNPGFCEDSPKQFTPSAHHNSADSASIHTQSIAIANRSRTDD